MFAQKPNQSIRPTHVYELKNNSNQLVTHPQEILSIFQKINLDHLSSSTFPISPSALSLLKNISISVLITSQLDKLTALCTDEEIL